MRQIQLLFFVIDEETKAQLSNFLGLNNKSVVESGYEPRKSNKGYTLAIAHIFSYRKCP